MILKFRYYHQIESESILLRIIYKILFRVCCALNDAEENIQITEAFEYSIAVMHMDSDKLV